MCSKLCSLQLKGSFCKAFKTVSETTNLSVSDSIIGITSHSLAIEELRIRTFRFSMVSEKNAQFF